jgi:hypothetical protein
MHDVEVMFSVQVLNITNRFSRPDGVARRAQDIRSTFDLRSWVVYDDLMATLAEETRLILDHLVLSGRGSRSVSRMNDQNPHHLPSW